MPPSGGGELGSHQVSENVCALWEADAGSEVPPESRYTRLGTPAAFITPRNGMLFGVPKMRLEGN